MKRAMGERNESERVVAVGLDGVDGGDWRGCHLERSKGWDSVAEGFGLGGERRLEKRPLPRTVGRFREGFRWP